MTTVKLEYYACFGRGDYSDTIEWEFNLTDEEYAAYCQAKEDGTPFEKVPVLQAVLDRAFREIAEEEAAILLENEDEYAIECSELPEPINPFVEGDYDLTVRFAEE